MAEIAGATLGLGLAFIALGGLLLGRRLDQLETRVKELEDYLQGGYEGNEGKPE